MSALLNDTIKATNPNCNYVAASYKYEDEQTAKVEKVAEFRQEARLQAPLVSEIVIAVLFNPESDTASDFKDWLNNYCSQEIMDILVSLLSGSERNCDQLERLAKEYRKETIDNHVMHKMESL